MVIKVSLNAFLKKNLKSTLILLAIFSFGLSFTGINDAIAQESKVPSWIKITAQWWGEEKISDQEYIDSLQYLLENEILSIPAPEASIDPVCGFGATFNEQTGDCEIPDEEDSTGVFPDAVSKHQSIVTSWIKVTALWWGQSKISDQDFVDAITYLAENRILSIPGPELEPAFQKLPEPINPLDTYPAYTGQYIFKNYPTYTTSWTNIDRMENFQAEGHSNSENYLFRFQLISVDRREIASDGTISISIIDENKRILYLNAFSVQKNDFSMQKKQFFKDDDLVYFWEIPTSDIKLGFGELGIAKIVFTDRGGNSFSSEFHDIAIPQFTKVQ